MIVTKTKRRTVITTVEVSKLERYKPIDIRVPSNATCITGILVTTSASWQNVGTLTIQASDQSDIFYTCYISPNNVVQSDEQIHWIEDSVTDSHRPWVTGHVPKLKPVQIAGDNVYLRAWFKGVVFADPFMLNVYVEYETAEEYIGTEPEHAPVEEEPKSFIL
jgi:hypothetical protein